MLETIDNNSNSNSISGFSYRPGMDTVSFHSIYLHGRTDNIQLHGRTDSNQLHGRTDSISTITFLAHF